MFLGRCGCRWVVVLCSMWEGVMISMVLVGVSVVVGLVVILRRLGSGMLGR